MKRNLQLLLTLLIGLTITSSLQAQLTFSDQTNVAQLFLSECGKSDTMTVRITAISAQTNVSVNASIPAQFTFVNWISTAGTTISGNTITVSSMAASTSIDLKFLLRANCGANSAATSYRVNYTISGASGGVVPLLPHKVLII